MNFSSTTEQLQYMLDKGIVTDAYLARQSHALLMSVGHHGPQIEGEAYTRFFRQLQGILGDHFIVHVTKLFERPHLQYPNISIPSILKVIEQNQDSLEIIQKGQVQQNLRALGVQIDPWNLSSHDTTRAIVSHFQSTLPTFDDSIPLKALLVLRDKRIAHREATDISSEVTTTFSDALSLVHYAEDFCCVIGPAYTNKLYGIAGEHFFLTDDARMAANSLEQLFSTILQSKKNVQA